MIRINDRKYILFRTNQLIVNHFGINPMNGGKPPNERKFNINENFNVLLEFRILNNCLMWNEFEILKIKIILILKIVYTVK